MSYAVSILLLPSGRRRLLGDLSATFWGELVCPLLATCCSALALGNCGRALVRFWWDLPGGFPDDLLIDLECGLDGIAWNASACSYGNTGGGPGIETAPLRLRLL